MKSISRTCVAIAPFGTAGQLSRADEYLAAIIEAYRWSANPTNRSQAAGMVAKHLKLDPDIAARSGEAAVGPSGGLTNDARFDMEGFKIR